MKEKLRLLLVPGMFLVAAGVFFYLQHPIAAGFCVFTAMATAKY
jgi:hypothetical protein